MNRRAGLPPHPPKLPIKKKPTESSRSAHAARYGARFLARARHAFAMMAE